MKKSLVSVFVSVQLTALMVLFSACDKLPSNTDSGRKTGGGSSVLAKSLNKVKTGVACDNQLKQLYIYCRSYRDENGQTLSAGETALNHLISAQNIPRSLLNCPAAAQSGSRNGSAAYLFCGLSSRPSVSSGLPVFFDKPGNHADGSAAVLLDNGEVVLLKGPFGTCYEILSSLCAVKRYSAEISNYYKQMGTAFDQLYKIGQ